MLINTFFSPCLLNYETGRLFPYDLMFNWLAYGNDPDPTRANPLGDRTYFARREWSFTIEGNAYLSIL